MELAGREHGNMVKAIAIAVANATGVLIERVGGVALLASGLPIRLFNQVLVESDHPTRSAIADVVGITRERGDRFVVNLRVGADDPFVSLMSDLGLVPLSATPWMPGMALHPIPDADASAPDGLRIVRVTDTAGLEDHIRVGVAGFGMPESIWHEVMSPRLLGQEDVAVYVGYMNGEAVSTGLGIQTGKTIGVYNIASVPEARGRGYATAMTRRVAADGARNGCDVAILQASDMGLPIYERIGYRTVVEYMGYIDPVPAA